MKDETRMPVGSIDQQQEPSDAAIGKVAQPRHDGLTSGVSPSPKFTLVGNPI